MKNLLKLSLVLGLAGMGTQFANAEEVSKPSPQQRIEKRMENQQKRIEEGKESGRLNENEAKSLEAQQSKIKADEARALSDGKLTRKEVKGLKVEQNRANRSIRRMKAKK